MKRKEKLTYIFLFCAVLTLEVLIALFVRDDFIRPYVGDMLVTVLICLFFRAFFPIRTKFLPLFVFLFAAAVEIGQYFDFVAVIGLENNRFFSILLGRTFSATDIVCYAVGCAVFFIAEKAFKKKQ